MEYFKIQMLRKLVAAVIIISHFQDLILFRQIITNGKERERVNVSLCLKRTYLFIFLFQNNRIIDRHKFICKVKNKVKFQNILENSYFYCFYSLLIKSFPSPFGRREIGHTGDGAIKITHYTGSDPIFSCKLHRYSRPSFTKLYQNDDFKLL